MNRLGAPRRSSVEDYFTSPAERLVIEGCRLATLGLGREAGADREAPLDAAWSLYNHLLDDDGAWTAFEALSDFVGALARCAACPLRSFSPGMRNLTRDEVLILGLVSGIQHGDDAVVRRCLDTLTCPARCAEVESAAAIFAVTLRGLGRKLLPIPLNAIEDILVRSNSVTIH